MKIIKNNSLHLVSIAVTFFVQVLNPRLWLVNINSSLTLNFAEAEGFTWLVNINGNLILNFAEAEGFTIY